MRKTLLGAMVLLAGVGCSRGSLAPDASTGARPITTQGELAGVRYLEHVTGGSRADDRLPMIVVLHPMGGDPADMLYLFERYSRPARLIFPYGHPGGGKYLWYDSVREDVAAPVVTREADRLAAVLAALVVARPTLGKPLVTGFSQGGIMTFALAVTHPESLAAAFPISGMLPPSLYPSAAISSRPRPRAFPPVMAFHGDVDLAVPTRSARASIAELQHAGYVAELHEFAGLGHDLSDQEQRALLERIGQAADALSVAAVRE